MRLHVESFKAFRKASLQSRVVTRLEGRVIWAGFSIREMADFKGLSKMQYMSIRRASLRN